MEARSGLFRPRGRSVRLWMFVAVMLVAVSGVVGRSAPVAQAAPTDGAGYRDFSFGTGTANPTAEKPQSKLWFNDGTWWGVLFDPVSQDFHIYRFDKQSQGWTDTGTLVDRRHNSRADVLWDGTHLYVASAPSSTTTTDQGSYVLRYSYDAATKRYSLNTGFPASVASGPIEAIVLDKDTTGQLWVTYTQGSKVYMNHSLATDDAKWGNPFVLPVYGTSVDPDDSISVDPDDISAVIAFESQIGVMWSNQTDGNFYFATHKDGDPDNVWQEEVAKGGIKVADDHMNLKSLQADSSGRVFAAVKTSLGDTANPDANAPGIWVLVRGADGAWKQPVTFGKVRDDHTRPILVIDEEKRNLYVFAAAPVSPGGTIYYKQASLDNISFPEGLGTPFIKSSTDTTINNATTSKHNVNSRSGILVLASDNASRYYLHNTIDLASPSDTTAPSIVSVSPTDGKTGVGRATNVAATFSEPIDSATLSSSTFKLVKDGTTTAISATRTLSSDGKTATLNPYGSSTTTLALCTRYKATVTTGVKDKAGNPLSANKVWYFRTQC